MNNRDKSSSLSPKNGKMKKRRNYSPDDEDDVCIPTKKYSQELTNN